MIEVEELPVSPATVNRVGLDAALRGNFAQSASCFETACRMEPRNIGYRTNLAVALMTLATNEPNPQVYAEQALHLFAQLLAQTPTNTELHGYLGAAYGLLGNAQAALRHLDRAPASFYVVHRRAVYHYELGHWEAALECCDNALMLRPDDAVAHYNRAILLLTQGRMTDGWREFEWRHLKPASMTQFMLTEYPAHAAWQGEDITSKHLMLVAEMGVGDMLQYARYIPMFAARSQTLSVYVPEPLRDLLRQNFPGVDVCDAMENFDLYAWMMSASLYFDLPAFSDAPPAPYLMAPTGDSWQTRFADLRGLKVGLIWSGQTGHSVDRTRSVPFAMLAPLLDLPCSFVSLQKTVEPRTVHGEGRYVSSDPPPDLEQHGVFDAAPWLESWSDTAQAIAALDLIISVDTAGLHLAGALGKPVWLLNRFNTCWRWGVTGSATPWYSSMRIFRQAHYGDWTSVIDEVEDALRRLI